jgi:hypothetical protein
MDTPAPEFWTHVARVVAWLDETQPGPQLHYRIEKMAQESGEVLEAFHGMLGANPRKGVCKTWADVTDETCDVLVTAAVALATLTNDVDEARRYLQGYLKRRGDRLTELLNQ